MRYLLFSLIPASLVVLLLTGCGKAKVASSDAAAGVNPAPTLSKLSDEQKAAKQRLERPLFKRPDNKPSVLISGKCVVCGKQSDKLYAIDAFHPKLGGVCSEQCANEWITKHMPRGTAAPLAPAGK